MSNHTPIIDGALVTCAGCAFRAILTNRAPFVREAGDTAIDHLALLDADLCARRAHVEQLLRGLVARYHAGHAGGISMRQVRRLGKYIKAEHGL